MERMTATEGFMKAQIQQLEEENKKLKEERDLYKARNEELNEDCFGLAKENKKLKERIKELEQCNLNLQTWLDNKEKVNKSLREELEKIKSTYVYDAKEVRDIC